MADPPKSDFTQTLLDLHAEKITSKEATDRVFEAVYDELRRLAGTLMRQERPDHTLQTTALVHEAYCRLADETRLEWQSRAHFFGIAARAMRQILVDHARKRARAKRGGDWERVALSDDPGLEAASPLEFLEFDEALTRLAAMDERMARVVELRVFAGMNAREVAHVLGISGRTVHDDWRVARMWFADEMAGDGR